MEVFAILKNADLSAQKVRLVVKEIRGLKVERAVETLHFMPKKAARVVKKVLESAISNAEYNAGLDIDELKISQICIDEAPTLKRMKPRAKGRGNRILKRRCHIKIAVSPSQIEREK